MTYQRIAMRSGSQTEDEAHEGREDLVDDKEKDRGDEHHDENHGRGDAGLLARRPGHARHFLPDLTKKLCGARFGHDRVRKLPSVTPAAPNSRSRASLSKWQEWRGSNPQPPVLETGALPVELHS